VKICNTNGDGFHLDEYLKKHKMEDMNDKLFVSRRDLRRSSDHIIDIFNGILNEIITGKRWEDIPRDWMGYK